MCSAVLPMAEVHLMMLPFRQEPRSYCFSMRSLKVGFQVRLVTGKFISSSFIVATLSPNIVLKICREPSKKLAATRLASELKRVWKTLASASSVRELRLK